MQRPSHTLTLATGYYSLLATVLKVLLMSVPINVNELIAATAISAAIKLYSIAVTPLSSLNNKVRIFIFNSLLVNHFAEQRRYILKVKIAS
jgi:hypothetical protein